VNVKALTILAVAFCLARAPSMAADIGALQIYAMEGRPISYFNGNAPDGMTVELAREVQRRIGSKEPIHIVPLARAIALANSQQSVLLLALVRNPEREPHYQFIGPIFETRIAAYAARSRAAELRKRDPGLKGLRAGARRGSVWASLARAGGYNLTDEANTDEGAARMLMQGRFDLWFEAEEVAGGALEKAGYSIDDVDLMLHLPPQPVYFAFSKATPSAVVHAWEQGLAELKRDGTFQRIHRKWFPTYALPGR